MDSPLREIYQRRQIGELNHPNKLIENLIQNTMEKEQQNIIEGKIEINYKIINDELMIVESYCDGVLLNTDYYMKKIYDKDYASEKLKREKQEKYLAEKYGIDIEKTHIYYFNIGPDKDDVICGFEARRSYKLNEKRKTAGWSRHDIKHDSEKRPVRLTREEAYQKDEKENNELRENNEFQTKIRKKYLNCFSEAKTCNNCSEEKICDKKLELLLRKLFPCCKNISTLNRNNKIIAVIRPFELFKASKNINKCLNCKGYQKYKDSEYIHIIRKKDIEEYNKENSDSIK